MESSVTGRWKRAGAAFRRGGYSSTPRQTVPWVDRRRRTFGFAAVLVWDAKEGPQMNADEENEENKVRSGERGQGLSVVRPSLRPSRLEGRAPVGTGFRLSPE